jgi:hypothetical protein
MLINAKDTYKYLQDVRKGTVREGVKLEVPEIDQYFRFKPTNFNVILGHANVGKTTVILYLMLCYTQKHNVKWLVFSSENEPHSVIRKLVEFLEQKPINRISDEVFKKHFDYVVEHFKVVSNDSLYTYRTLLEFARAFKKEFDYQGLLVDPYNSLTQDNEMIGQLGGHQYDYLATTEMRMFCKKEKVTIWLNTHANTAALRYKHPIGHEYVGHPIPPLASDVEGGGKFVNRADDFVVIHRYVQHPTEWMISHLHVRKVKEVETGGRPTPIDNPIKLRSIVNNVGFTIDNNSILKTELTNPKNIPF